MGEGSITRLTRRSVTNLPRLLADSFAVYSHSTIGRRPRHAGTTRDSNYCSLDILFVSLMTVIDITIGFTMWMMYWLMRRHDNIIMNYLLIPKLVERL